MTITVRRAETTEYDAVASLLVEAYESRFWITADYRAGLLDIQGHVGERGGEDLLVATADRSARLLGAVFVPRFTRIGPDGAAEQSFARLGVAPDAAGRGVGRALVAKVEAIARGRGAARVAINTGPQMHDAHRMYEHLGYVRRPERETLVVDSGQRLLFYAHELDGSAAEPDLDDVVDAVVAGPDSTSRGRAIWEAHLIRLDIRLRTRRYLTGRAVGEIDRRLLPALLRLEPTRFLALPSLWAYARDLLAVPGIVDAAELTEAGILGPDADGTALARWAAPVHRAHLGG